MKSKDIQLKCICCGKKLEYLHDGEGTPASDMWNGAIVDKIVAGYGSSFDTDTFTIGICDACMATKVEAGDVIRHDWTTQ